MTTAYINAGGRGTRLNGLFQPDPDKGIAKALIEIGNPAIKLIDHHIGKMSVFNNVIVAAGDQPLVAEYAASQGVEYYTTPHQYGTGGELIAAVRDKAIRGTIMVSNCDTIVDIDLEAMALTHMVKGGGVTIALTQNKGVPNEDAFCLEDDGRVVYSAESGAGRIGGAKRGSSTGVVAVDADFLCNFQWEPADGQLSLYRDLLGESIRRGCAYSYDNGHKFFQDLGTVAAFQEFAFSDVVQKLLVYKERVNG